MLRLFWFLVGPLFFSSVSYADIQAVSVKNADVKQYELVVVDVELKAEWVSPYSASDIALDAHITTPSGKTLILPGFYVEGESGATSDWRLHFAPSEIGQYEMELVLKSQGGRSESRSGVSFTSKVGDKQGYLHANDLWTLQFDNGDLFRGLGINYGWEPRDKDDSKYFSELHEDPRFEYQNMLPKLRDKGANIIRTWMIYWNLPVDWQTVKNASRYENSTDRFNESGIERMDDLIGLAEDSDIHLILVLDSHAGYIGDAWSINPYNKMNGGHASSPEDFFTNERSKNQYKEKLRYMVARWGYSTNIAAWELFNEVDNIIYQEGESVIPDKVVSDWHKEMSDYLVAIDPFDHIVTTSISHRDVAGLNHLENIHINQRHMYRVTDEIPQTIRHYTQEAGKPYVIGEFGYEWDWRKNFDDIRDEKIRDFKKGLWYGVFSPTPILPMSWWWEYFDEQDVFSYFSCVSEMSDHVIATATSPLTERVIKLENVKVDVMAIDNGKKTFLYISNSSSSAQEISAESVFASVEGASTVQMYSCVSGEGEYSRLFRSKSDPADDLSIGSGDHAVLIVN